MPIQSNQHMREVLQLWLDCLTMSTPLLIDDPAQVPTQIHGRMLAISPSQAEDIDRANSRSRRPWLRLRSPSLGAPGGALKFTFHHADEVMGVAISADGSRALSGSLDGRLHLWDLMNGTAIIELQAEMGYPALAISPDGKRLAFNSEDPEEVLVVECEQASPIARYPGNAAQIKFAGSGENLVWVTDQALHFHAIETKASATLVKQPGIFQISTSRDGRFMAYAQNKKGYASDFDQAIGRASSKTVIALLDRQEGSSAAISEKIEATCVAINEDGAVLLVGCEDGTVHAFSGRSRRELAVLAGHSEEVSAICVSGDGLSAVSGSRDGSLRIWNLANWSVAAVLTLPAAVQAVDLSLDGKIAVAGCQDGTVQIFDVQAAAARSISGTDNHWSRVTQALFDPGGTRAAIQLQDGTISIGDFAKESGPAQEQVAAGDLLDFDGKRLVVAHDQALEVFHVTGEPRLLSSFQLPRDLSGAAITPGGRLVAANGEPAIHIWEPSGSHRSLSLVDQETRLKYQRAADPNLGMPNVVTGAVRVSPDGNWVMTRFGWSGAPDLWDIHQGKKLRTYNLPESAWSARQWDTDALFSRVVVVSQKKGANQCSVSIFKIQSGELIASHVLDGDFTYVTVSADGTVAAVQRYGSGILAIHLDTGEILGSFNGDAPIEAVTINHDGSLILAVESSGQMHYLSVEGLDSARKL